MRTCIVDGCERRHYARDACEAHYRRSRRTGTLSTDIEVGARPSRRCSAASCERIATARGLCHGHYLRALRRGDVDADRPLTRRVNDTCSVERCRRPAVAGQLCRTHRNRKRKCGDVQADKPIRQLGGGTVTHGYRVVPVPPELRRLTRGRRRETEHRLVLSRLLGRPLFADESVHHRNGDRLDNRPENLELWSR